MMKDIYNVTLLDILPDSLKHDSEVRALAEAITPELQSISSDIIQCVLLTRISELPEDVVDLLAWQFHADFYEFDLPLEKKQELVSRFFSFHRIKGTPAVVEDLVTTIFEDETKVVEWFEYTGDPYTFKLSTNEYPVEPTDIARFVKALNSVKNLRSWFTKVHIVNKGIFLEHRDDKLLFWYETGVIKVGRWPWWNSIGQLRKKDVGITGLLFVGSYIYPHAGVSVGSVGRKDVGVTPFTVTGEWLFPRASVPCGVSPEVQTFGALQNVSVGAEMITGLGTCDFPRAGVSVGLVFDAGITSGLLAYAAKSEYVWCGLYHSGQEVA